MTMPHPTLPPRDAVLFCAIVASLLAASPCRADIRVTGGAAPAALAPTAIAGTMAYAAVPDVLDPATADDAHLAQYGFPPRPDPRHAPDAYLSWTQAVVGVQRLNPVLQPVAVYHGPLRRAAHRTAGVSSSNWSGYVVAADAFNFGSQSLTGVYADWTVPVAQPDFGACKITPDGAAVYSSTWVGIDGNGSGDVLQAGTESDAVCSAGKIGAYQGAWYEWYPYNEVRITNLPVAPGSVMFAYVWASSATQGHAYLVNKTAHQAVAVAFSAPPGTQLTGNSAEWVVERPTVNGELAQLTNYVQEFFGNAHAHDANGLEYFPGSGLVHSHQPGLQIQMTDDADAVISTPLLLGRNSIWFMDQGSARMPG